MEPQILSIDLQYPGVVLRGISATEVPGTPFHTSLLIIPDPVHVLGPGGNTVKDWKTGKGWRKSGIS